MSVKLPENILDNIRMLQHKYYVYDIETYPNIFTIAFENPLKPEDGKRVFEISDRINDVRLIFKTLRWMERENVILVGYNNLAFDYPVIHYLLTELDSNFEGEYLAKKLHEKANLLIKAFGDQAFRNIIWYNDQLIRQCDLYKIHHFDNKAKMTSLKMLEFNMRADNIKDLPFPPNTVLSHEEMDVLKYYNQHDTAMTTDFFKHSIAEIAFREKLSDQYNKYMLCDNDMKIGKNYFIMELEKRLGKHICYEYIEGERTPRQTIRESIDIGALILPCIKFNSPTFNTVKSWLEKQVIYETKGVFTGISYESLEKDGNYTERRSEDNNFIVRRRGNREIPLANEIKYNILQFMDQVEQEKKLKNGKVEIEDVFIKNLHCYYKGFRFDFGTGGLHGSISSSTIESDDEWLIVDLDVASFYPSINIMYRLYPAHLGEEFADIYNDVRTMRFSYSKDKPENAMLKLALNAAGFGDTNNAFSPFYDPLMTMTITVNGQLMLCMLAERLMDNVPEMQMIQANTDGVTVKIRREHITILEEIWDQWEKDTGMVLERDDYSKMFIRDVNNYLSVYDKYDKVKRKGSYGYDLGWHQNHSALIVPKTASEVLVNNVNAREYIENHDDDLDFALRTKVPRSSKLVGVNDLLDVTDESIPKWYRNADAHDRYVVEKTGIDIIRQTHEELVLSGEIEVPDGKSPTRYNEVALTLDISCKQYELGLKCIEDDSLGLKLPTTVEMTKLQNITRYIISNEGVELMKVMPPLKTKAGYRYLSVNKGCKVLVCDDIKDLDMSKINYDWYESEVTKLVSPVMN